MSVGDRQLSSGAGTAGYAGTGVAPGAHRGRGLGEGLGRTERSDAWWFKPLLQGVAAVVAVGYAIWSGPKVEGSTFGSYHSPFHAELFRLPVWWAVYLNLAIPVAFRATCYYFRRSYYRSFFADPPACAVGEPRKGYTGESRFPFVLQNVHRYMLYLAVALMIVHWTNVVRAFSFDGRVGVGVGTLLLIVDTVLLSLYTLSCHAFRHIIGGHVDCYSCVRAGEARRQAWSVVSMLNGHHMGFFWWSLYTICLADLYIRLCSAGVIQDAVLLRF